MRATGWRCTAAPKGDAPTGFDLDLRVARKRGSGVAYETDTVAKVEDFEDLSVFGEKWLRQECTHDWRAEQGKSGEECLVCEVTNRSSDADGYSEMGRGFYPPLSLPDHRALGFWVKSDGKGEWIKFQLLDGNGGLAVYPVRASFWGWGYVEITQPTPFRGLDYSNIVGMVVYFQKVPPGTTCVCALDGIRALGSVSPSRVRDLPLTLGGKPIAAPATQEHVETVVVAPDGSCRLLGKGGTTLASSPAPQTPPELLPGENVIEVRYDPDAGACEFEARVMRLLP